MKVLSKEMSTQLKYISVISDTPGRIRLRVLPEYRQHRKMANAATTLKSSFPTSVGEVRTNVQTGSMTVYYASESNQLENSVLLLENLDSWFGDIPQEAIADISLSDLSESPSDIADVPESLEGVADSRSEQSDSSFAAEPKSPESVGLEQAEIAAAPEPVAPPSLRENEESSAEATGGSLRQSELARRLQVSVSTLSRHRSNADFPQWSKLKDPESIEWHFDASKSLFHPLE